MRARLPTIGLVLLGCSSERLADDTAPADAATPASSVIVQDYEHGADGIEAASDTGTTVEFSIEADADGTNHYLAVDYTCAEQGLHDVWATPLNADWTGGRALSLRVNPDRELRLSVSFIDGNNQGWTQQSSTLSAAEWQTVELVLADFFRNPYGPTPLDPDAPMLLDGVQSFGFSTLLCDTHRLLVDDFLAVQ